MVTSEDDLFMSPSRTECRIQWNIYQLYSIVTRSVIEQLLTLSLKRPQMYETGTSYGALLGKCRVFFEFMENKNTLRISNLLYKFALRVTNMNILVE